MKNDSHVLYKKSMHPTLGIALFILELMLAGRISLEPFYWVSNYFGWTARELTADASVLKVVIFGALFYMVSKLNDIEYIVEYTYPTLQKGWKTPFFSNLYKAEKLDVQKDLDIGIEQKENLFYEIVVRNEKASFVVHGLPNLKPLEKELDNLLQGPFTGLTKRPTQRLNFN